MTAVILTVATGLFAYFIDGVLIGFALAAVRLRYGTPPLDRKLFLGLLVCFAALDLYWLPAVLSLDPSVRIRNPNAAALFGEWWDASTIIGFGWFDVLVWAVQGVVAIGIAERLSKEARNAI